MKRIKAACIQQTLVFAQKEDCGLTREQQRKLNHDEISSYKATMDRRHTKYQIVEETEQSDGSVLRLCVVATVGVSPRGGACYRKHLLVFLS